MISQWEPFFNEMGFKLNRWKRFLDEISISGRRWRCSVMLCIWSASLFEMELQGGFHSIPQDRMSHQGKDGELFSSTWHLHLVSVIWLRYISTSSINQKPTFGEIYPGLRLKVPAAICASCILGKGQVEWAGLPRQGFEMVLIQTLGDDFLWGGSNSASQCGAEEMSDRWSC